MTSREARRPSGNRSLDFAGLYTVAASQAGHFTTQQAIDVGFTSQALQKHLQAGRIARVLHGIYRLVQFPVDSLEALAVFDLWAGKRGVFSHEIALVAHELSDVLPVDVCMTLPTAWRARRLRLPPGLRLYYADLTAGERAWHGPVRVTKPYRTLSDCIDADFRPDLVLQAFDEACARGLLSDDEVQLVNAKLGPWREQRVAQ